MHTLQEFKFPVVNVFRRARPRHITTHNSRRRACTNTAALSVVYHDGTRADNTTGTQCYVRHDCRAPPNPDMFSDMDKSPLIIKEGLVFQVDNPVLVVRLN